MSRNVNYDCTLEYGSTTIPLMLTTDPSTKLKKFLSYYASPLGQSLQTGEASSANFPPEQELTIEQKEFHGGMGWTNAFQERNNKVYAQSNGVDARVRGKLKLAPKENSATITTQTALTTANFPNMDFETWSDATTIGTWSKTSTAQAGITNREGTEKQGGTYSCNIVAPHVVWYSEGFETWVNATTPTYWTYSGAGAALRDSTNQRQGTYCAKLESTLCEVIYQDVTWNIWYKGTAFTFTCYLKTNTASKARISIEDGVGTTYSSYHTGGGAWGQITVTRTLDANATHLRLQINNEGSATVYADGEMTLTEHIGDISLYQDLATYQDYYDGKTFTFTCYSKTALASNIRIGISDGVTTTYSSYHTGGNAWENLTVSKQPVSTANMIRLIIERNSDTYAITDYVDTATFTQTSVRGNPLAPQSFIQFLTDYYYLENKTIFKLSSTTFTEVYTFEDAITGVEVYGANMIVSVGTGDYYYYTADGTTWTRTSTASYKMIQLKTVSDTLYGTDTTYSVKTATNPISGAWSSNTTFGNTSTSITDIAEYNQTVFTGKADNLYYLDSSGAPQSVAPDFKGLTSANNCLGMKAWQGALWIPLNNGMYRYTYPQYHNLVNVSPESYMSAFTDYHGRVHAVAGDLNWLYVACSSSSATSSKTPILSCRYESIQDVEVETDVRFHSLLNVDLDDVISMDVYSSKLWIAGKKSTTAYIRYLSLANDDYPTSGTNIFYTSYYDSGFPSFFKSYHSFELQSENLTANITTKVEFQLDGGSWTELSGTGTGTFTSSTAPQVKYFQSNTYGRKIRFRFTMTTNSGTTTPVITGFIVRGALRPDTLRVQEWYIDCSDDLTVNNGLSAHNIASKLKSDLETAKAQSWPLTIYDPYGTTWYGFIKSPTPDIQGYECSLGTGKDKRIKSVIHIILQEAKLNA